MLRKFFEGLVFGTGFAIAFLVIWLVGSYWITPRVVGAQIEAVNKKLESSQSSFEAATQRMVNAGDKDGVPFHELSLDDQIAQSSAIALARFEPASDGRMRAVIKEFLKKDPKAEVYYKVGDEYAGASHYPKENTEYGDGVIIFHAGSPATMRMSMSYSGDRVASLGDIPLAVLRDKCSKPTEQ